MAKTEKSISSPGASDMAEDLPKALADLLHAGDSATRERAWSEFLRQYNRYILGTTRFLGHDYDAAMDRYRFVLEELWRDDFSRLREYCSQPTSRFSTWLVVVVRRLCYDFQRNRYGRSRAESGVEARQSLEVRRRLQDLIAEQLDAEVSEDEDRSSPERRVRENQLSDAVAAALEQIGAEERLLLKLRFEDGVPVKRIAEVLRLRSEFQVYRRLDKILMALRKRLEEEGIRDAAP